MKFPPEINVGSCSWPVLVLGLQVIGVFPYTMHKTDPKPKFSIVLFLWSIFVQVLLLIGIFWNINCSTLTLLTSEVGNNVFIYSLSAFMISMSIAAVSLLIKSKKLANLLMDLSANNGTEHESRKPWYRNMKTLAYLSMIIVFPMLALQYLYTIIGITTVGELIFTAIFMVLIILHYFVPLELSEKMFTLLMKQLSSTGETTLARLRQIEDNEENSDTLISALQDLQREARKIEKLRCRAVDYLFVFINLMLLMSIVGATCASYALLKKNNMYGGTISLSAMSYSLIFHFCHRGTLFSRQVTEVLDGLEDREDHITNTYGRTKISETISKVEKMRPFSVCGWYTLDYSTLLSIVNTIVTYLVILMQVGGQSIQQFQP